MLLSYCLFYFILMAELVVYVPQLLLFIINHNSYNESVFRMFYVSNVCFKMLFFAYVCKALWINEPALLQVESSKVIWSIGRAVVCAIILPPHGFGQCVLSLRLINIYKVFCKVWHFPKSDCGFSKVFTTRLGFSTLTYYTFFIHTPYNKCNPLRLSKSVCST